MNDGTTLTDGVNDPLHEETQVHDGGLDVTSSYVHPLFHN